MRSGSSAHDGDGWPSDPGSYGPGRRSEPHEIPGGRREPQFGPDVSWPNGFRQIEPEARRLLESGYSTPGYGRGQYDHVDPGYGAGGRGSGYRQQDSYSSGPSADDYGDPGYSDPSYDGPRGGSGGRAWPGESRGPRPPAVSDSPGYGGYHLPDYREPARPEAGYQYGYASSDIYPTTGAQEALPATGPQPIADGWSGRDPGSSRSGRQAYPEQRHDRSRLDDPRGPRSDGPPAPDPRLQGMRYDELRYDEPRYSEPRYDEPRYDEPLAGGPGYDEPLDDDAWVAELRRSAPAFPQLPGGQPGADQRRGDSRGTGYRQQPGYGPQTGMGQSGGYPQAFGQGRDDRGGPGPATPMGPTAPRGPRMSAGSEAGPRSISGPRDRGFAGDPYSYSAAPTAQVGVLTPPAIRRLEEPSDTAPQPVAPSVSPAAAQPAAAGVGQVLAPPVRPGHGLDGPEITSSWPAQPQTEDQDSFAEFWAEDDDDADYTGLFPGEGPDAERGGARTKSSGRRIGRRRGRSNDHRLWLALLGVLVVAAGAIFGILKFEFPSHSGPTHDMGTPPRIGSYMRTVDMEKQAKLDKLKAEVIKMSAGQASNVVDAVYESGNSAAGATEQIVMFIGGHLANADPASSISSFLQKFPGAVAVPAGALGGKAACVDEAPGTSNSLAMCVWFDNDSFGEVVSPTMNATALSNLMRTMRSSLEHVVPK